MSCNKSSVIKFLLEEGINPNINDSEKFPILATLAFNGNLEMIELYLKKGGKLNVVDEINGWNALHYSASNAMHDSAQNPQLETTKFLISIGVDYKHISHNGKTPLMLVKNKRKTTAVQTYLESVTKK